jgi:hypothetical protein
MAAVLSSIGRVTRSRLAANERGPECLPTLDRQKEQYDIIGIELFKPRIG